MGEQQKVNQADTDLNHVLKARRDKLAELQAAGKDPFQITKYDVTAHSMDIKDNYEQWEGKEAAIAGRMMFKRVMGKASFCNVQDLKGSIQVYVARDSVGEESYKDFKKMDIGDIVGVKGKAFTTKTGEISIHATEVTLLSKSLQVLPEKFHGLTDTDMRYRQRYVDLIMNAEVKDTFIKRSRILAAIRKYLGGEGFMEVETPMLVSNAGGAAARPFETHFNALDEDLKLRISLELYLKRLIVGGLERVYEIGRVFRNEGLDTRHNPEFTLMELYQAYTDYNGMMDLTEKLYRFVAQEVLGTTTITYKGVEMDLGKPFARITMVDAVKKYAGVDFDQIHTLEEARAIAKEKGARRCLPLKVSGPFHTSLLAPPGDALREKFKETAFGAMRIPVLFNCLGREMGPEDTIPALLEKQVQTSVYMEDTIRRLAELGVDTIVEIGPGKALIGFVKKTAPAIKTYAVETCADLDALSAALKG